MIFSLGVHKILLTVSLHPPLQGGCLRVEREKEKHNYAILHYAALQEEENLEVEWDKHTGGVT